MRQYPEQDDSDEESTPILESQPLNRQQVEQINKHRKLVQAVYGLNYVWVVSSLIVIVGLSTYILTINIPSIDSYFPFFLIVCGEMVVFIILHHIVQLIFKALKNRDQKGNGASDWLVSNENKIPLVLFSVKLVMYFAFIHALMITSEVLLYLSYLNTLSWVYSLAPLVVFCSHTLLISLFTRLNHILVTISAVITLIWTIFVALEEWSYVSYPWYVILLPLILLVTLWVLVLCHIFYLLQVGVVRLKSGQHQAFYLYLCGFLILIIDLLYWRLNIDYFEENGDYTIPLCMIVVAIIFFSSAFAMDFFTYLDQNIRKMGSTLPIPLRQNNKGQWVVNETKKHHNYVLLGNLEPGSNFNDDEVDETMNRTNFLAYG